MRGQKIAIVGTGYVGLVSGVCLAGLGHPTICIDQDETKIDSLRRGQLPIFEPGLDRMLDEAVNKGSLAFSSNLQEAVAKADAIFITVGTPPLDDGRADLSAIVQVANQLAKACRTATTIVIKSTVPPGTGRMVARLLHEGAPKLVFSMGSNPEFLREGSAVDDFMNPDRIVIGCADERARRTLKSIYGPFADRGVPIVETDIVTAELIKYAANAFLAVKVAYTNELAMLCGTLGGNVDELVHAVGLDHRIGSKYLEPGPGYGGSCFPKDVNALAAIAQEADSPVRVVEAVSLSNSHHVRRLVRAATDFCALHWAGDLPSRTGLEGRRIAILGLTFKAETDDVRNSVSMVVIRQLLQLGAVVRAYDPKGMENARMLFPQIDYAASPEHAIADADAAIILTGWKTIKDLPPHIFRKLMHRAILIDYRNIFEPLEMAKAGVEYMSLGRPYVEAVEPLEIARAASTGS